MIVCWILFDPDQPEIYPSEREVVRARALMCQAAAKRMGYSGAREARSLEVTTSTVNRIVAETRLTVLNDTSINMSLHPRPFVPSLLIFLRLLKNAQMQGPRIS
jgi:hypothetical protein